MGDCGRGGGSGPHLGSGRGYGRRASGKGRQGGTVVIDWGTVEYDRMLFINYINIFFGYSKICQNGITLLNRIASRDERETYRCQGKIGIGLKIG